VPELDRQIAAGNFTGLFAWLRQHVHGVGAKVSAQELLKDATGKTLSAASFVRHLETRYLESAGTAPSSAAA
jgi:carboxypeptidase Taq